MIVWVVDELLGENAYASGYPSLADAAEEAGHIVVRTKYKPFTEVPDLPPWLAWQAAQIRPIVVYGTVQFCKQIEKHYGKLWRPGLYFNHNVKNFARYAPHYAGSLLNSDYYILPFGEVRFRTDLDTGPLFIKPESGLKEFTGQVFSTLKDLDLLSPHSTIDQETLCVLASPKEIKAEFRFVICNKRVVAGSEYRWDNVLDVRRDVHPLAKELADRVAQAEYQPDTVYVVDIALVERTVVEDHCDYVTYQEARIVELNAFSSSGLYACDTYAIVGAVSDAALREFDGDVDG